MPRMITDHGGVSTRKNAAAPRATTSNLIEGAMVGQRSLAVILSILVDRKGLVNFTLS